MSSLELLDAWITELEQSTGSVGTKSKKNSSESSAEILIDTWISQLESGGSVQKQKNNKPQKPNQANKPKQEKAKGGAEAEAIVGEVHAGHLEMRVGKLVNVWPHPESDKLFCEEIDIGEGSPRLIASGLRAFYKQEELNGRRCIVLANLKPKKMGGFASNGMVMCASNAAHDQVLLVEPPADAPIGSLVTFDGLEGGPTSSAQEKKKKIFETCAPFFQTGENGVCEYKGIPFKVGEFGVCTAPVPAGYSIS
jgi:aminoacyl tRNA synthase complex-interacting multifunctional protein 1